MKILFPFYPLFSGSYPAKTVHGGVITSSCLQLDALIEAGEDVTVLSSNDFSINDPRVKHIKGDFQSKEKIGRAPWTALARKVLEVAEEFDIIILNMVELPMTNESIREGFRKILPKVRVILHHYDSVPFSSFLITQYQFISWVQTEGGKCFTVSKLFNSYTEKLFKNPEIVSSNPYRNPHLPTGRQKFQHIDMTLSVRPEQKLSETGGYVLIGRASSEKNILLGIKAFLESGVDSHLRVFTCQTGEKGTAENLQRILGYGSSPRVSISVLAERGEVLSALSECKCVLCPSKKESFGLVAMEALSYGCGLIYSERHSFFADGLGTLVEKPTVKSFAKAIREHITDGTKQERSDAFRDKYSLEAFRKRYVEAIR